MDKKLKIIIILTSIITIAFFVVMVLMIQKNGECIDNPFIYSAKKLKESGGYYNCYCDSLDPRLLDFSFSEEGVEIKDPLDYEISNLNLKGGIVK